MLEDMGGTRRIRIKMDADIIESANDIETVVKKNRNVLSEFIFNEGNHGL